ncbi:MAG: hypothetical protein ACU84Q_16075 [Gammaproteobacteria bacterium]
MTKINFAILCVMLIAISGCGKEEPESYGGIPKETLDQVAKDAEEATEEAKKKIDEALQNME